MLITSCYFPCKKAPVVFPLQGNTTGKHYRGLAKDPCSVSIHKFIMEIENYHILKHAPNEILK
jgi:hypothetical protein